MNADDALKQIATIIQEPYTVKKRLDRIYRVLVQAGAIAVPGVTTGTKPKSDVAR